jgi:flagellar assembly protein FliH
MDGSTFLGDVAAAPGSLGEMFGLGDSYGILYVEDFDAPPQSREPAAAAPPAAVPAAPEPVFTASDLAAAHAAGRAEGLQAALEEAGLLQAQLQSAATQALADALAAGRASLERIVAAQAAEAARTVLAMLRSAVPATMARHGRAELDAVIAALLPGLASEPELRVRAHPGLADHVRETLITLLGADGGVLSVAADPALAPGDLRIAWADGSARRDCAEIYAAIRDALAPLNLPALEELRRGE